MLLLHETHQVRRNRESELDEAYRSGSMSRLLRTVNRPPLT